jgi:glycosyltransferase involved in cell wall biosynthesis
MKIIHLIDQFDFCDGCARHVYFLAQSQTRNGHDVCVVAGKEDAFSLLGKEGVAHHLLPSIYHSNRSLAGFFLGAVRLRRLFHTLRPDIIHAHHFYAANQARLSLPRGKLVFTIHANLPEVGWLPKYPGDAVIAVSESTKEAALKRKKSLLQKIFVIPNTSRFLGLENGIALTPSFRYVREKKGGTFVVAYTGRLVRVKGVHILFEALAQLQKEFSVACVVAGDGTEEKELKDLAARLTIDATFLGTVRDIRPLLELADVVVLPSLSSEGLPMTLFEAGSLGKAVVASLTDGIPEIIHNGVSGLLVRPGNISDLTDALRHLYSNPGLRHELGAALHDRVKRYSVASMAENVEEVYRTLLAFH